MLKRLTGGCCALLFTLSCSTISNYTSPTLIAEQSKIDSVEFKDFRKDTYVKIEELKEARNIKNITEEIIEEVEVAKMIVEEEIVENNKEYWTFEVSYYCSCSHCCGVETGITASGDCVQEGVTIATPSDIPFYSTVYIEGLGKYIVQDRGGYIEYTYDDYGNLVMRLDVYVSDHNRAYELGRHYSSGYIIRSE